ncbi:MAG: tetratricopeptide repeat protein [Planctomycetota bacterium]|jgi:tetratricopeptide (TPR) repeat protein
MTTKNLTVILVCSFLSGLTTSSKAELPEEQTHSLFNQANEEFRQANLATAGSKQAEKLYEKSILIFEKIINDRQVKNARLYYNLGNAYFLKGDIGKAILNYRRAENLDKADTNIQKNLSFARSRRFDKVELKTEKRVLQTLFFWHYDFSLKTKFLITCIFFAIVCISTTVIIWLGRNAPGTVTVIIAGILTVCFFVSVIVEVSNQANRTCGVITASEVVARQGDGQNYPASFKESLHAGTEFDLLEHRPGWLHIRLGDDSEGWIPEISADLI